jgi:hypothetical protein
MNPREIKYIDNNEITEEHIFLGIYEENSKESSVLNTMINMSKFSFWKSRDIIRYHVIFSRRYGFYPILLYDYSCKINVLKFLLEYYKNDINHS